MEKKKSCCGFFKKLFSRKPQDNSPHINQAAFTTKSKIEENCSIPKSPESNIKQNASENSMNVSDSNYIFYDKNSKIYESIDKKKAIDNLKDAFEFVINDQSESPSKNKDLEEKFTKVIKNINFKEIMAEESIIISDPSINSSVSN